MVLIVSRDVFGRVCVTVCEGAGEGGGGMVGVAQGLIPDASAGEKGGGFIGLAS